MMYLIHFHPTPRQRLRNFPHPDLYRNQAIFYPLPAGAFPSLLPIEIGWVMSDLGHYQPWRFLSRLDDPITWILTVITLFLLLRTEISRLSIDAIRRAPQIARFFYPSAAWWRWELSWQSLPFWLRRISSAAGL